MLKDNSILFYISHTTNNLKFGCNVRTFSFNVISENVINDLGKQLDDCFNEIKNDNSNLLLIADWSKANISNCSDIFLPFIERLIEKIKNLKTPSWKRKYREQPSRTILINAFDAANISEELVQQIIPLHQKIYVLQENLNTFLLPTFSSSLEETSSPQLSILPQEVLERILKDNLELITLLFLERGDKSGYQILKEMAGHFHCILSQGTLYPLLYQLERENKLVKKKGKGREVVYSLIPEMKNQLKSKKETCFQAYNYLTSFFNL